MLVYYYLGLIRPRREFAERTQRDTGITHVKTIYGPSTNDRFEKPHSVALDSQNNIYVADTKKGRVVVFDKNGEFKFVFGKKATSNELKSGSGIKGKLYWPIGLAIDNTNGNIFVSDDQKHAIVVFDKAGKFLREWLIMAPTKLNILNDKLFATTYGPIYILDKNSKTKFGKVLKKIGKKGRGDFEFYYPNGIGFSNDKKVFYVPDSQNQRIFAFSMDGDILWVSGKPSKKMNDVGIIYEVPVGIAVDENNLIYSMELLKGSISVTSSKGKKIGSYGEIGEQEDQFTYPTDIQYMGNRRFVIADRGLDRIQIIDFAVDEKMSRAIEKETGKKVAITTNKSLYERVIDFFKTILGL